MTIGVQAGSGAGARVRANGRGGTWIAGMVLTVIVWAFLAFDVVGKFARPQAVVDGTTGLGFEQRDILTIGLLLLIGLVLWTIPRTAVLGAVWISAYLGGAVAVNLAGGFGVAGYVLSPVYVGVAIWVAMFLRRPELRKAFFG
ncbi:DoxX family protein [Tsukamurella sp. 8F]|uniref:DoxX family protein n=1 Tax=unclassified Tsukamurella TaxID=2633480 RepID=UPI0023B8B89D|nr:MULTISPECIES: DoxX family protein [unclassified Tsukamurella]MDF0531995.1 DoxX family protein [Tsukamurella sp. 8J]MDF0588894.1 DoxX family protein [Tsukamurella sp. 8F]